MSEVPFTMDEATAMLNCSEEAVVAMIERGEVSAIKRGRSWVFPRGAFLRSLDDLADAERAARRAQFEARQKAGAAIKKASGPAKRGRRARPAPVLQQLP
jgi:excisionase family DNA binding protein